MSYALVLAGTGHRPDKLIGGYSEETFRRLVSLARWALEKHTPTWIISGMALGWDQALAQAAVESRIPFDAAVPFAGQESRWPKLSIEKYKTLLAKARRVVIVSEGGYAAWKMQKRNEWMSNNASALLALWNGSDGGTANCVKYARGIGKPIHNVWDEWMRREVERLRVEAKTLRDVESGGDE